MDMIKKRIALLVVLLACLCVLAFVPFDLRIAPAHTFKIIDSENTPIGNAVIRQTWYQYSLGVSGEEEFTSNLSGIVNIPLRSVETSWFKLLKGAYKQFSELGIHAGYFSDESISVVSNNYKKLWIYKNDIPINGEVQLNKL